MQAYLHLRMLAVEHLHKDGQVSVDDQEELEGDNPPLKGIVHACVGQRMWTHPSKIMAIAVEQQRLSSKQLQQVSTGILPQHKLLLAELMMQIKSRTVQSSADSPHTYSLSSSSPTITRGKGKMSPSFTAPRPSSHSSLSVRHSWVMWPMPPRVTCKKRAGWLREVSD